MSVYENENFYINKYYQNANEDAIKKNYKKFILHENENEMKNEKYKYIFYYDCKNNKIYYLRDYIPGSFNTFSFRFIEVTNDYIIDNIFNTNIMKEIIY